MNKWWKSCRCDNVTKHFGVPGPAFIDLHKGQFSEMKRQFLEYVSNLRQQKTSLLVPGSDTLTVPVPDSLPVPMISVTSNGYLILPDVDFKAMKKIDLENLMCTYLSTHYSMSSNCLWFMSWLAELASSGNAWHVPFASVECETSKFISPVFLPASFIIKDPWNQRKDEIESLLGHIKSRQEKHMPEEVFQFCGYQRKGDTKLKIANYPDGKQTKNQECKKKAAPRRASNAVEQQHRHNLNHQLARPHWHQDNQPWGYWHGLCHLPASQQQVYYIWIKCKWIPSLLMVFTQFHLAMAQVMGNQYTSCWQLHEC